MSNFIQNLKEKPESYRRRIAIVFSGSFALFVFAVVLVLFFGNFSEYAEMKSLEPKKESALSKISQSYNDYKKSFDESDLAKRMEGTTFSKSETYDTTNASGSATTTIQR